jgi:hypothetical protein
MTRQAATLTSMTGCFMEEFMGIYRLNCRQINHVREKFIISSFLEKGRMMYAYSLSLLISKIRTCKEGRMNCLKCEIKSVFLYEA